MAEINTVARPYAVAAFRYARENGELERWAEMLELATTVARDARMVALARDPNVGRKRTAEIFLGVCGDRLSPAAVNFVNALAEHDRLLVLPQIRDMFTSLKQDAEARVEVEVSAAFPVTDEQQRQLAEALQRRLGKTVTVTTQVDQGLVGGVVIRAGDQVIDASLRGRLEQLGNSLMS